MGWLDLHMHSCYSDDGEFHPRQLMALCAAAGVRTAAIADHNSVGAVKEASYFSLLYGVSLIPAIELDVTFRKVDLHLLGYFIDISHPFWQNNYTRIEEQEKAAAKEKIKKVQDIGIAIDAQSLQQNSPAGIITGELLAENALSCARNKDNPLLSPYRPGGTRSDNPLVNFYWDFCSQGKPAYVPIQFISLEEGVSYILEAGGIPILAHPGVNVKEDQGLIEKIFDAGVCGLEVYSSYHSNTQVAFYKSIVDNYQKSATIGSDFHGKIKPAIQLGSVSCGGQESLLMERLLKDRSARAPL